MSDTTPGTGDKTFVRGDKSVCVCVGEGGAGTLLGGPPVLQTAQM